MTALITNVNNPKLKRLMGSVSIMTMGRKNALKMPKATAAKTADGITPMQIAENARSVRVIEILKMHSK